MWRFEGIEPEVLDYRTMSVVSPGYELRPEIVESAFYLSHYIQDAKYPAMGRDILADLGEMGPHLRRAMRREERGQQTGSATQCRATPWPRPSSPLPAVRSGGARLRSSDLEYRGPSADARLDRVKGCRAKHSSSAFGLTLQAAAEVRLRRMRSAAPMPAKPVSMSAQAPGSGAAPAGPVMLAKDCPRSMLPFNRFVPRRKLLN